MPSNFLSAFGRMGYAAHLTLYPILGGSFYLMYKTNAASSAAKAEALELKSMPKSTPVDPDNFQPFSAIPYHNNSELRYRYANTKMHGYLDAKTHMNAKDYTYKYFHHSYDHDDKKEYTYNWVSMVPSDDA